MPSSQLRVPGWLIGMLTITAIAFSLSLVADTYLSLSLYLLASTIVMFDGIDFAVRLWRRHNVMRRSKQLAASTRPPKPFAILVSIHNMERDIDTLLHDLRQYRQHVWIIDDASTDGTVTRLRASGWRFLEAPTNRKKPAAIHYLLKRLPVEIGTVMILDPDTTLPDNLGERISAFQNSGAAAMCPKVIARPDGALVEFQHIEYTLSFDLGRHGLSPQTVTSGVAIYDRRALDNAMQHHSLSVYGEDLENAVTILGGGGNIIYDPELVVETDGKRDLFGWFSQRVGWSFSLFKIYVEHHQDIRKLMMRSPMAFYQFGVYFGILGILLWPLKVASVVLLTYSGLNTIDELLALNLIANNEYNHPVLIASSYVQYTAIVFSAYVVVVPRRDLKRGLLFLPLFFFYCMLLVFPTTIGYLNWLCLRLFGIRLFNDHYDSQPVLSGQQRPSAHQ